MPAICRVAAVNRRMRCFRLNPVAGFGAAAQPIVGKPDSYALRAEAWTADFVGARLAREASSGVYLTQRIHSFAYNPRSTGCVSNP